MFYFFNLIDHFIVLHKFSNPSAQPFHILQC